MQASEQPVLRDLVLVGGGHSHVVVLHMLAMRPEPGLRITLICTDVDTPYSGMLPGYISGHYSFDEVHIDLGRLAAFAGARFIHGEVTGLDRANQRVLLKGRPSVPYDLLSINTGSTPNVRRVDGAQAHAVPVKPIAQFNQRWLALLERVRGLRERFTVAVVGGGAGGVELVLSMQYRLRAELQRLGKSPDLLRFVLLTAGETLLPTHNPGVRARFVRVLKERHLHRLFRAHDGGERVLVVGFSDEANAFLRYLGQQKKPAYQVVGLIDHSRRHVGRRLQNAKVLGSTDDLPDIVARFQSNNMPVSKIVVSPSKTDPAAMEAILVQATDLGLPVFTLPDASDLTQNDDGKPIRPTVIKLDDLLDRPIADIDLKPVAALLRNKVILVTGGGGSIGSGLVEQVLGYNPQRLVILDSSEHNLYAIEHRMREVFPYQDIKAILADVRESATIRSIMGQERPDIVFHAAALKHVPMVEHNPLEGAKTNVLGTVHVANAAVEAGVAVMVMISTDKAVNPTNVMGATKRFAEAYCQLLDRRPDHATRFMTVRFGNVLGSSGSVVPLFSRQIAAGGPVTITHPEMKRYFMSMKEAVRLVLAACAKGVASPAERGKIMVLHMGTQV
ncbi:MAG: polysaccharide biosynthesis protein, partial [Hydrogenophaga sp.]|nr:polysaccharide biosynthesis protein [Hydrogenophaga sp.]